MLINLHAAYRYNKNLQTQIHLRMSEWRLRLTKQDIFKSVNQKISLLLK